MHTLDRVARRKGRGALSNPAGRYEPLQRLATDDGWDGLESEPPALRTVFTADRSRSAITRNQSPDVPFEASINPYQGCEHGCVYCFARPSHAYWNLGSGIDFETRIFHKPGLAQLLEREITATGYRCEPINLGANTDPYQPAERRFRSTRSVLEVLLEHRHPVTIVTKGLLVLRDLDLLTELARRDLVSVMISLTTLDDALKRRMEPRAAAPQSRLRCIEALSGAGVPTGVLLAPVIPALNEPELERLVAAAKTAGASSAGYLLLRLPGELGVLFEEWLQEHYPERARRVLGLLRELRGGRLNDPRFGHRMKGEGPYADLLAARFAAACRRVGLRQGSPVELDRSSFRPGCPAQGDLDF
jgi:DNA repair photolyase